MNREEFVNWVNAEAEKRGWSYRELGRRSGLSVAAISRVLSGAAKPGLDFCVKVALALNVPAVETLELAGLVPPQRIKPEDRLDPLLREVIEAWPELPQFARESILNMVRSMIELASE